MKKRHSEEQIIRSCAKRNRAKRQSRMFAGSTTLSRRSKSAIRHNHFASTSRYLICSMRSARQLGCAHSRWCHITRRSARP
jgi:hypothetical protein